MADIKFIDKDIKAKQPPLQYIVVNQKICLDYLVFKRKGMNLTVYLVIDQKIKRLQPLMLMIIF